MDCVPITECIACGDSNLELVLDLKKQPLANHYSKKTKKKYPLAINRCTNCDHVQLTHLVDPAIIYKDYAYVSGVSKPLVAWFDQVVSLANEQYEETPKTVLDIGCNDGSMLDAWGKNVETYGVDPAENLYPISSGKGHNIHCGFFSGKEFDGKTFDVITVLNAFAHNANQKDLLNNIKSIMHDDSILICSVSQADMILNGEFDTIYHEHLSFYNIKSMNELCKRTGLNLIDVVKHDIHGGSYLFIVSKTKECAEHIQTLIDEETARGVHDPETYVDFAIKSCDMAKNFAEMIRAWKQMGVPVIGYTSPAKGNTLLNFAGEGPDYIFDDTPQKQNMLSPGLDIPVYKTDFKSLNEYNTVVFIPLAWNYFPHMVKKIQDVRGDRNDMFLKTFPKLELYDRNRFGSTYE